MKNKLFNSRLFIEGLRRGYPLGIVFALVTAVAFTVPQIILQSKYGSYNATSGYADAYFYPYILPAIIFFVFIASTALVYRVFSFLNKRGASDYYFSLQYSRLCVYMSLASIALVLVYGALVLSAAASYIFFFVAEISLDVANIHYIFLAALTASTLTAGAALIAVTVTGTRLSGIAVTAIILFVPRILFLLVCKALYAITAIAAFGELGIMDPALSLPTAFVFSLAGLFKSFHVTVATVFSGTSAMLYTLCAGLVCILAAGWLFSRRRAELAGQSAPGRKSQTAIRCLLALPFLMVAVIRFAYKQGTKQQSDLLYILLIIASILVYFGYELITTRKLKPLLKAAPFFLAPAALAVLLALGTLLLAVNIVHFVPKAKDIAYFSVITKDSGSSQPQDNQDETNYTQLLESDIRYKEPEILQSVSDELNTVSKQSGKSGRYLQTDRYYRIALKDGRVINRFLDNVPGGFSEYDMKDYWNTVRKFPGNRQITSLSVGSHNDALAKQIWATFKTEAEALDTKQFAQICSDFTDYTASIPMEDPENLQPIYGFSSFDGSDYGGSYAFGDIDLTGYLGLKKFSEQYWLTRFTPKASNLFLKADFEEALPAYKKLIQQILSADANSEYSYTVTLYNIQYKGARNQTFSFGGQQTAQDADSLSSDKGGQDSDDSTSDTNTQASGVYTSDTDAQDSGDYASDTDAQDSGDYASDTDDQDSGDYASDTDDQGSGDYASDTDDPDSDDASSDTLAQDKKLFGIINTIDFQPADALQPLVIININGFGSEDAQNSLSLCTAITQQQAESILGLFQQDTDNSEQ